MMDSLIQRLDKLPWNDWQQSHGRVEALFNAIWTHNRNDFILSIADFITKLGYPRITKTAELHSWELHRGDGYDVKLNQFIPYAPSGRSSEGIHHHTRPLTTLTIKGGYSQNYYTTRKQPDEYMEGEHFCMAKDLHAMPGPTTKPGHVYTIDPDIFHGLTGFEDGTLTFVVYGKIVRQKITVFNTTTGLVDKRTTCGFASANMVKALRQLASE